MGADDDHVPPPLPSTTPTNNNDNNNVLDEKGQEEDAATEEETTTPPAPAKKKATKKRKASTTRGAAAAARAAAPSTTTKEGDEDADDGGQEDDDGKVDKTTSATAKKKRKTKKASSAAKKKKAAGPSLTGTKKDKSQTLPRGTPPFETMLYLLLKFKSNEGHCKVPPSCSKQEYPHLYDWYLHLRNQKRRQEAGELAIPLTEDGAAGPNDLTAERLAILDDAHFPWDNLDDEKFNQMLRELHTYQTQHGHCK